MTNWEILVSVALWDMNRKPGRPCTGNSLMKVIHTCTELEQIQLGGYS